MTSGRFFIFIVKVFTFFECSKATFESSRLNSQSRYLFLLLAKREMFLLVGLIDFGEKNDEDLFLVKRLFEFRKEFQLLKSRDLLERVEQQEKSKNLKNFFDRLFLFCFSFSIKERSVEISINERFSFVRRKQSS